MSSLAQHLQQRNSVLKWIGLGVLFLFMTFNADAQTKKWALQTDDTKIVLGLNNKGQLSLLELRNPRQNFNWVKHPSVLPYMSKVFSGKDTILTNWKFRSAAVDTNGGTIVTLVFANAEPALEITSVWQARKGPGPIRLSMFISNHSGKTITISNQESIDVTVAGPAGKTSVTYINDDASVPDRIGVYQDLLNNTFTKNLRISEVQDWIPFVALHDETRYGMYIGWEWSIGRLSVNKKSDEEQVQLKAGNGDGFRTNILAEETFKVPSAFIGAYAGDMDDCGNSLRKYLFNYSIPAQIRKDSSFPKVEWNAFAALGKEQSGWDPVESKYYPLINDIAPLGFEEVVIDVGWWSAYGDPGQIITDSVDWPSGMQAAAKYAKDRGVRFGLYDNESENLTSDSGKSERIRDVSYLINGLHADFYRSDATAGPVASGTYGEGLRASYKEDVEYWSIQGFYDVIDSLYRKIPPFLWENCSSGGGLKDYGAVKRASKVQNQDVYYPVEARRSFYDASHVLHPMQLASVVGSWKPWQAAGSVYEFRSASMGAAYWHPDAPNGGNGGPVWTEEHKAEIKKAVTTYKEKLRPLIRNANLYHIFPRPDSVRWDGIEYFDPVTKKGVVYFFKPSDNGDTQAIKLKGLDPALSYTLTFEDHSNKTMELKGNVLMKEGVMVSLKGILASELMFITETNKK